MHLIAVFKLTLIAAMSILLLLLLDYYCYCSTIAWNIGMIAWTTVIIALTIVVIAWILLLLLFDWLLLLWLVQIDWVRFKINNWYRFAVNDLYLPNDDDPNKPHKRINDQFKDEATNNDDESDSDWRGAESKS